MKALGIILGLMFISTPILVFGQSLSELDKQLDEQNMQKVKEMQEGQEQSSSFSTIDCPIGQIEKAVSGGGIICVDDPNFQSNISLDENTWYIVIGVIIVIIIIAAIAKSKEGMVGERRGFSSSIKHQVLKRQDHRCNECNRVLDVVDYDHMDGNRSNNDISNCQALCPNCHAIKSRKAQMGEN